MCVEYLEKGLCCLDTGFPVAARQLCGVQQAATIE